VRIASRFYLSLYDQILAGQQHRRQLAAITYVMTVRLTYAEAVVFCEAEEADHRRWTNRLVHFFEKPG
jgi:hypothetical protein